MSGLKMNSLMYYNYYDTPDGKDLFPKLLYTTKCAAFVGVAYSTYDVILISHPKGYAPTIARYLKITSPLVGMATAFTLTTYAACTMREKDDSYNYFLGGAAAGALYGSLKKSIGRGIGFGLALGCIGFAKKVSKEDGWEFFPDPKRRMKSSLTPSDYSLYPDPGKNWTTNPDEA